MLKHVRSGLFAWGVILAVAGIIINGYGLQWGLWFILGGTLLIAGGIANAILTSQYNNRLVNERGAVLTGQCIYCHQVVSIERRRFRPHRRNFPEGYADCPVCHNHLSLRVFEPFV